MKKELYGMNRSWKESLRIARDIVSKGYSWDINYIRKDKGSKNHLSQTNMK